MGDAAMMAPDPLSLFPSDSEGRALPGTVHRFPIADIPEAIAGGWQPLPFDGWLLWPSTAPLVLPALSGFWCCLPSRGFNDMGNSHTEGICNELSALVAINNGTSGTEDSLSGQVLEIWLTHNSLLQPHGGIVPAAYRGSIVHGPRRRALCRSGCLSIMSGGYVEVAILPGFPR